MSKYRILKNQNSGYFIQRRVSCFWLPLGNPLFKETGYEAPIFQIKYFETFREAEDCVFELQAFKPRQNKKQNKKIKNRVIRYY